MRIRRFFDANEASEPSAAEPDGTSRNPRPRRRLLASHLAAAFIAVAAVSAFGAAARLDRLQVSAAQLASFLRGEPSSAPPEAGGSDEPAVNVTWYQARDYCLAQGKRLPSAQEWIGACEAGNLDFPWEIWEWTSTEAAGEGAGTEAAFKLLCGPGPVCGCSHSYHPTWKNAVKGFRCALPEPSVRVPPPAAPRRLQALR